MELQTKVTKAFIDRFDHAPTWVVRAPGRVNLIGEHTDYNDGYVMPLAIDRQILIALCKRTDQKVLVHSLDYDETLEILPSSLISRGNTGWGEYVSAIAFVMTRAGYGLQGWDGVVAGDIPKGAGLSSSAALELAVANAFTLASDIPWEPLKMAQLSQQAENEWVGMQCGIMDQMISACGIAGHALMIDCRSLEHTPVALPHGTAVVVMDTGTRRGLLDSAYNERRRQCQEAAQMFGKTVLRDVDRNTFEKGAFKLTDLQRRRARHVIAENNRVLLAMQAMQSQDAHALGRLMVASHTSLRDDFEVSSRELNIMVECALKAPGCLGARMTGAGFGGCAVALITAEARTPFTDIVTQKYVDATGIQPSMYVCQAKGGVDILPDGSFSQ
ncbi:MAG: galactokinase [Deltaproteobacteria bacterium]|nr:galactokinase [Deltaproteobacteria bacterium]